MPDSATEDLAQKTITTIDRALKSGQVTSMPELVRIIRALSSDEGRVSLSELADLINQDQTVLMRVVAAANTFGYNPSGMEITSVTGAIHAIGFTRVRTLAMSLLLHDHAELTVSPAEQRQMANISLCSGMIAQITAESSPLISPQLAFLCASLRNFGPLLLRTFLTQPGARARLVRSALKDVGKIVVVAVVLDTTYQILVLKSFYLGELLLVVLATAIVPYLVVRSAVSLLMRRVYRKQSQPARPEEVPKIATASKPNTDH